MAVTEWRVTRSFLHGDAPDPEEVARLLAPLVRARLGRPVVGHPGEHRLQGHTAAAAGIHDDTGGATLYLASQSAEEDEGAV